MKNLLKTLNNKNRKNKKTLLIIKKISKILISINYFHKFKKKNKKILINSKYKLKIKLKINGLEKHLILKRNNKSSIHFKELTKITGISMIQKQIVYCQDL